MFCYRMLEDGKFSPCEDVGPHLVIRRMPHPDEGLDACATELVLVRRRVNRPGKTPDPLGFRRAQQQMRSFIGPHIEPGLDALVYLPAGVELSRDLERALAALVIGAASVAKREAHRYAGAARFTAG